MSGDLNEQKRDTAREGVRPAFSGGTGSTDPGETPAGLNVDEKRERNRAAAAELAGGEEVAGVGASEGGDGVTAAREKESAGGLYKGGGGFSSLGKKLRGVRGVKGLKGAATSGRGAMAAILLMIFGGGGVILGLQTFQPFALVAQFQEDLNSMHVSSALRSRYLLTKQMDSNRVKHPYKKGMLLFGKDFKISEKQSAELKKQGIEFDDNFEGTGKKVFKYTDDNGEIRIITGSRADAEELTKMDLSQFNTNEKKYNVKAVDFRTFYTTNLNFATHYDNGSKTWRGQFASWFGSRTNKLLTNVRNRWAGYSEKTKGGTKAAKEAVQERLAKGTTEIKDGGIRTQTEDGTDEDGKPKYSESNESASSMKRGDVSAIETKIDNLRAKMAGSANAVCAVTGFIGGINLLLVAHLAMQILSVTAGFFEAVDKTKAGYGDEAPIHVFGGALNGARSETEVVLKENPERQIDPNINGSIENYKDEDDKLETLLVEEVETGEKSAMESSGIASFFGGGAINPKDPSVQAMNPLSAMPIVLGGIGTSMDAFYNCIVSRVVTASVSAAIDVATVVACVATAGLGCAGLAVKELGRFAVGVITSVALSNILAAIAKTLTPWMFSIFKKDIIATLSGEDFGNALASGANLYQGNVHRANGGSAATKEEYERFAVARQEINAEYARYERTTLSPFDLTSKNTFMGTLMTQMMSFSRATSLMTTVTAGGTTLVASTKGLMPEASAIARNIAENLPESMEVYEKTCPYLATANAIGDAFCNPYTVSDVETMTVDPADIINALDDHGDFLDEVTSDGNVKIDPDSDLMKWIKFCSERASPLGVNDYNIADAVDAGQIKTSSGTADATLNGAVGAVPIIGDGLDIMGSIESLRNAGYVSGESCVAGNEGINAKASASPDWSTARYYQRFIEDQSLAEAMGLIEQSAVTTALEEYYEKNPIDESYEGKLARYSGLDKETVEDLLAVIKYGEYLANYDPETRYAFGEAETERPKLIFENENQLASAPNLLARISYRDLRYRSFAV